MLKPTEGQRRAYAALYAAAEVIGRNNYRRMGNRYRVTVEHRRLVEAMSAVLSGKISVDEAMALLHDHDVMEQRFPKQESQS